MKILVAVDGSDAAFNALRSMCALAKKTYAYVTAFHVNKGGEYTAEETGWLSLRDKISSELETVGEKVIYRAYEIGKESGVQVEGIMSYGIPKDEILKYADTYGIIKLIAMGHSSKGKGTEEFVDSTTRHVVGRASTPVFVTSSMVEIKNILIAVDASEASRRAVSFGGWLAKSIGAGLCAVSFIPDAQATIDEYTRIAEVPSIKKYIDASEKALRETAERALALATDTLTSMGLSATLSVKKGWIEEEIIKEASRYNLLVIAKDGMQNKLLHSHHINTLFVQ